MFYIKLIQKEGVFFTTSNQITFNKNGCLLEYSGYKLMLYGSTTTINEMIKSIDSNRRELILDVREILKDINVKSLFDIDLIVDTTSDINTYRLFPFNNLNKFKLLENE